MIHAPWHLHTTRELTPHHIVVTSQWGSFRVCRTRRARGCFWATQHRLIDLLIGKNMDYYGFTDLSYILAKLIPASRSDSCGKAHPCSSWGHSFPQIETSGDWASVVSQDRCNREIIVKTQYDPIKWLFNHLSVTIQSLNHWIFDDFWVVLRGIQL